MLNIHRIDKVLISADGENFSPLGELEDVTLFTQYDESEENYKSFFYDKECTITGTIEHFNYRAWAVILSGKKLFGKCPKKIRRSRKYRYLLNYLRFK